MPSRNYRDALIALYGPDHQGVLRSMVDTVWVHRSIETAERNKKRLQKWRMKWAIYHRHDINRIPPATMAILSSE